MKKEPIRVAHIIGKMVAGGVENVVFNYYREIDKTKIQFDFFYDADSVVEPPKELIDLGARFYKIPPYQNIIKYIKSLYCIFKKNNYKIVHSHMNTLSVFSLLAAKMADIPVRVAHNHSVPDGRDWKRNIMKNLLKQFSKVYSTDYFACSEKAGRWLFSDKSYDNGEVYLLKNAIYFDKYNIEKSTRDEILDKYNLKNKFVVGHVGRFTLAKNHNFLLEIFKEIVNQNENAILLLIGDGELREEIVNKIKSLNLENNIVMTGRVLNTEVYYSVMDVILIPSIFEGLSLTAIEAQASFVPVVSSHAVPLEAKISDGFYYLNLDDSALTWAKLTLDIVNKPCNFIESYNDYDIKKTTRNLEKWYLDKIGLYKNRENIYMMESKKEEK